MCLGWKKVCVRRGGLFESDANSCQYLRNGCHHHSSIFFISSTPPPTVTQSSTKTTHILYSNRIAFRPHTQTREFFHFSIILSQSIIIMATKMDTTTTSAPRSIKKKRLHRIRETIFKMLKKRYVSPL